MGTYGSGDAGKNLDIALVMCPSWGVDMPPLGLAYLSTYLGSKGLKTRVIDLNVRLYNDARRDYESFWPREKSRCVSGDEYSEKRLEIFGRHIENYAKEIISTDAKTIGFSINQSNFPFTLELGKKVREYDDERTIVFGGPGCYFEYERRHYFPRGLADIFVVGEAEETLCDTLRCIGNGTPLGNVLGISFKNNGEYSEVRPRKPVMDLDSLPFPTYEEFDLGEYSEKCLPLLSSRGCIGRCNFCNDYFMYGQYRSRSAESVLREIEYHIDTNGITGFYFNDFVLDGNLEQLLQFCGLVADSGHEIMWGGNMVARRDLSDEIFARMRDAGCFQLVFGIESGSENTLRRMNKIFTVKDAKMALESCHRAGIRTLINIIVGFPGETEDDFNETIEFLQNNSEHIDGILNLSTCFIPPQCDLEKNPGKYGVTLPDIGHWCRWHDDCGNDYEKRKDKVRRIVSVLDDIGMPLQQINQHDEPQ